MMTRDEILDALEDERERTLDVLESLPESALEEPGVIENWSVVDILAHISRWESELVKLLWQARQGGKPTSVYLSGMDIDQINATWYENARNRGLTQVMQDLRDVRKQTERRVLAFSDRELNDPTAMNWLNGRPLWKWIAEISFEHEAEHREQIQAWRTSKGL